MGGREIPTRDGGPSDPTMKRVATLSLTALALAASAAPAAGARGCGAAADRPASATVASERATLCLLNHERRANGLRRLSANSDLRLAGARHARDMVERKYFAHTAPGGTSFVARIKRTDYIPSRASFSLGENLAWGVGADSTPRQIVRQWMDSPGHRVNILERSYRQIGVAIVRGVPIAGVDGGATYATEFGTLYR